MRRGTALVVPDLTLALFHVKLWSITGAAWLRRN